MANNMVRFIVDVVSRGAGASKKQLNDVADATNKVASSSEHADKAASKHFDTQAKGVIGTANSTRSFSKLAQTMNGGGGSSVVGAYATLAANVFALSAAFNALKAAAQVQQVESGLVALGARMGQTLTSASRDLKELTSNTLSTEQAMRSAAQVFSAGFKSDDLEKIGKVARDASFALGREMTDSMDRLTRGVIKLEPELLDELGIMTRLGEATALYAAKTGKVESALTVTERRQAFLNAVLAEGEAKFGGLAEAAGNSRAFDQLSATVKDLTKDVLGFINLAALPLASFFANNPTALAGGALLFASTIKDQLLPGLNSLQDRAVKVAAAYKEMAKEQLKAVKSIKAQAEAKDEGDFLAALGVGKIKGLGDKSEYGKFINALDADDDNALTDGRREKAIANLDKEIVKATKGIAKLRETDEGYGAAMERLNTIQSTRTALLYDSVKAEKMVAAARQQVAAAEAEYRKMSGIANAQTTGASAIEAANVNKYGEAFNNLKTAVGQYNTAQMQTAKGAGVAARGMAVVRTASFATSVGVRVLGAAFLNLIPVLGQLMFAFGLLVTAYNTLRSDKSKEIDKAVTTLSDTVKTLSGSYKELDRVRKSGVTSAAFVMRQAEVELSVNRELIESLQDLSAAYNFTAKASPSGVKGPAKSINEMISGIDQGSEAAKVFNLQGLESVLWMGKETKALQQMYAALQKNNPEVIKMAGNLDGLDREVQVDRLTKALQEQGIQLERSATALRKMDEGAKQAGAALDGLIKKGAGSTSVDGVVDGLSSVLNGYKDNPNREAADAAMTGLEMSARRFLDTTTQQAIVDKQLIETTVVRGKTLTANEKIAVDLAKERMSQTSLTAAGVQEQLVRQKEIFAIEQRRMILSQAELSLANALLSKYADSYDLTVAGVNKKLDLQNKAVDAQVKELEFSKSILQIDIQSNNAAIQLLKQELESLEVMKKRLEEKTKELTLDWERYEIELKRSAQEAKNQYERARFEQEAFRARNRIVELGKVDVEQSRAIEEAEHSRQNSLRSLESQAKTLNAQMQAMNTSIAAAQTGYATEADRAFATNQVMIRNYKTQLDMYTSAASASLDIMDAQEAISRTLKSGNTSLLRSVQILRERSKVEKENAQLRQNAEIAELQNNLQRAKADSKRSDEIPYWEWQLANRQTMFEVESKSLEVRQRQAELELFMFNTQSEGIEFQKTALSYMEKQVSVQNELAKSAGDLETARTALARRSAGLGSRVRSEDRADEIRTASIAYESAVRESEVKKAVIDLEFALLEAQAEQLRTNLIERRRLIAEEAPSAANNNRLAQVDATIANLDRSLNALPRTLASSKAVIDNSVAQARTELQTALKPSGAGINAYAFGERQLQEARNQATQALRTLPTVVNEAVRPVIESQGNLVVSNNALVDILDRLYPVMNQLAKASEFNSSTNSVAGLSKREFAEVLGREIQSMGFRVDEQSAFGGVTRGAHRGRGHAEDRALDVNIGTGLIEANDPAARAKMDRLENYLKQKYGDAIKIIWKTEEHFNHMHVEVVRAITRAAETAQTAAESMSTSVPTQVADIVVNASRPQRETMDPMGRLDIQPLQVFAPEVVNTTDQLIDRFTRFSDLASELRKGFEDLGPNGEAMIALIDGTDIFAERLQNAREAFKTGDMTDKVIAGAAVASSALDTVQKMLEAGSRAKVELIDKEIAAEQARDGKSAESIAKIASLEKKKDAMQRKSFEINKKLQMGQAVIATASGMAQALTLGPIIGPIMAGVIGAMGAAQLAIIAGTSYQSTSSSSSGVSNASPSSLTVGKRGDSIDLARNNPNAGGEIGYLRGAQGYGKNSSDYALIGSAYGGRNQRGYGNTGILVGEKGPEILSPDMPMRVDPVETMAQQPAGQPVQFNIQALDAKGVEEILHGQRGNIIGMLREAANANGQRFLEDVNVNVYTQPNVGRL